MNHTMPDVYTLSEAKAVACHGLRELLRDLHITQDAWDAQVTDFLAGRTEAIHLTYTSGWFQFEQTSQFIRDPRTDDAQMWDTFRWHVVSKVTIDGQVGRSAGTTGSFLVRRQESS